jgi:hypothetical protein
MHRAIKKPFTSIRNLAAARAAVQATPLNCAIPTSKQGNSRFDIRDLKYEFSTLEAKAVSTVTLSGTLESYDFDNAVAAGGHDPLPHTYAHLTLTLYASPRPYDGTMPPEALGVILGFSSWPSPPVGSDGNVHLPSVYNSGEISRIPRWENIALSLYCGKWWHFPAHAAPL